MSLRANKHTIELFRPFVTECGHSFDNATVCYEEYGNPHGKVILVAHGGLSNQHAAGKYSDDNNDSGWWDALIGPNKPIDTNQYRVICTNSLGSMFGSTCAKSINPATGKRFGPDFPEITLIDTTRFMKAFLDQLGIQKLFMMIGPSMGSLQTLQMAALYPDFVECVIAIATSGRMPPSGMAMHHFMINAVEMDPEFNGGWYNDGEAHHSLRMIHQVAKIYYTHEKCIKSLCWDTIPDGADAQNLRSQRVGDYLIKTLHHDILERDPNCYITLAKTANSYDLGIGAQDYHLGVQRIKCPVLLINFDTDCEFAPEWAHEIATILNQNNPGQCRARIIETPWGHLGCLQETPQIGNLILDFLQEVQEVQEVHEVIDTCNARLAAQ